MRMRLRSLYLSGGLAVVAVLMSYTSVAACQAHEALTSISGYVTDQTGARVPGAKVSLSLEPAGPVTATVRADGAGEFALQAKPGEYALDIVASGFAWLKIMHLNLRNEPRALGRVELRVGDGGCLVCYEPQTLPLDTDYRTLTTLIDPISLPRYSQPARRFKRHRWAWRSA